MDEKTIYMKSKLSVCALGLALGVVKGIWLMLLAWAAWKFSYGMPMVEHVAHIYHWYGASFVGGLYGAIYGFVSGFVFGVVFGFIYNFFLCRCCKKSCSIDK